MSIKNKFLKSPTLKLNIGIFFIKINSTILENCNVKIIMYTNNYRINLNI